MTPEEQSAFEVLLTNFVQTNQPKREPWLLRWWPLVVFILPLLFSVGVGWTKMSITQKELSTEITRGDSLTRTAVFDLFKANVVSDNNNFEKVNYNFQIIEYQFDDKKFNFMPLNPKK